MRSIFLSLLLVSSGAFAAGSDDPDDMDIEGVAGKRLPKMQAPQRLPSTVVPGSEQDKRWRANSVAEANARPYENVVYVGARALDLPPDYIEQTRVGFGKVFERDYKGARRHFVALDQSFPGTGISGSVDTLVWQALMLENFDFRYDRQYNLAHDKAMGDLKAALKDPAHQGWEHFQVAGLLGVGAIHMVRKGTYLPALNQAFEAMDHIQKAREASPNFTDLNIADGMYNYWRTVVTMSSKMLPDFGDNRALGISQIQQVERGGVFLSKPATMALAFSWLEERDYKQATNACMRLKRAYPNNVINNLLTAQAQIYQRRFDSALKTLNEIKATAPDNNRVHYYMGLAYLRKGEPKTAIQKLERYLSSDHLEGWQKASGHYRLGQAHYKLKAYDSAHYQYQLAIKETGHKPSKRALDRMKKLKKQGSIKY
ncbi:MAG: tetratricopeptide repeat protein [Myxococcota bacterium]